MSGPTARLPAVLKRLSLTSWLVHEPEQNRGQDDPARHILGLVLQLPDSFSWLRRLHSAASLQAAQFVASMRIEKVPKVGPPFESK